MIFQPFGPRSSSKRSCAWLREIGPPPRGFVFHLEVGEDDAAMVLLRGLKDAQSDAEALVAGEVGVDLILEGQKVVHLVAVKGGEQTALGVGLRGRREWSPRTAAAARSSNTAASAFSFFCFWSGFVALASGGAALASCGVLEGADCDWAASARTKARRMMGTRIRARLVTLRSPDCVRTLPRKMYSAWRTSTTATTKACTGGRYCSQVIAEKRRREAGAPGAELSPPPITPLKPKDGLNGPLARFCPNPRTARRRG